MEAAASDSGLPMAFSSMGPQFFTDHDRQRIDDNLP